MTAKFTLAAALAAAIAFSGMPAFAAPVLSPIDGALQQIAQTTDDGTSATKKKSKKKKTAKKKSSSSTKTAKKKTKKPTTTTG
jgi:Skp family chaperone for outer membrane proteins